MAQETQSQRQRPQANYFHIFDTYTLDFDINITAGFPVKEVRFRTAYYATSDTAANIIYMYSNLPFASDGDVVATFNNFAYTNGAEPPTEIRYMGNGTDVISYILREPMVLYGQHRFTITNSDAAAVTTVHGILYMELLG